MTQSQPRIPDESLQMASVLAENLVGDEGCYGPEKFIGITKVVFFFLPCGFRFRVFLIFSQASAEALVSQILPHAIYIYIYISCVRVCA